MPAQIRIDIVSDVMCPWCIVGYLQLAEAMRRTGIAAGLRWHPFELNPDMPAEGQNLTEHITEKYGITPAQSAENRVRLQAIGRDLGFTFAFSPDSRMRNSFRAHQLIDWADGTTAGTAAQHRVKLALFAAHFTDGRDVSDIAVLADIAAAAGLDAEAAREALQTQSNAATVRAKQRFWRDQQINSVPAMVFQQQYLFSGAQGIDAYADILTQLAARAAESPLSPEPVAR